MDHMALTEPWSHRYIHSQSQAGLVIPQSFHPELPESRAKASPIQHTTSPSVTGSSVLGIKFKDGVMIAADNLASYGSLARFPDIERIISVGDYTAVGFGGDVSDMQHIEHLLEAVIYHNDGHVISAPHIHEYLSRVLYNRRSRVNPLWNTIIVAGVRPDADQPIDYVGRGKAWEDGSDSFLAYVDLYGTTYRDTSVATGFGAHLARPIMRRELESRGGPENLTAQEARAVLDDCLRVLYYRDARSLNRFSVATITREGVSIDKNQTVEAHWEVARYVTGYGRTYKY